MSTTSRSGFPPTDDDSSPEIMEATLVSKNPPINEYIAENPIHDMSSAVYVGFWVRFVAYIIDFIVLFIIGIPLGVISFAFAMSDTTLNVLSYIVAIMYFVYYDSSEYQGTIGKQVMGVIIVDEGGRRLTPLHATGRLFCKILNFLTAGVGYLVIGFTAKKTGLHDLLASTYVVKK